MEHIDTLLFTFCYMLYVVDHFYPALQTSQDYILLDSYLQERIEKNELDIKDIQISHETVHSMISLRNKLKVLSAIFPIPEVIEAMSLIEK